MLRVSNNNKCGCDDSVTKLKFDIILVGSGLSALYTCYNLVKKKPYLRICVLEREDYLGGKICTNREGCDFGPMRFFPSIHPRFEKLVKKLNVPVYPVNLYTGDMILRGQKYEISEPVEKTSEKYHLTTKDNIMTDEFGGEFANAIHLDVLNSKTNKFSKLKKAYRDVLLNRKNELSETLRPPEYRENLVKELSNINYRNEITCENANKDDKLAMSEDLYNYFTDTNSYSDIWSEDICFAEGLLLSNSTQGVTDQYFVRNGMQTVVSKLVAEIQNICSNVYFILNSNVVLIKKDKEKTAVSFINTKSNKESEAVCDHLFLCYGYEIFDRIPIYINNSISRYNSIRDFYNQNISKISLFKIFLHFKTPFWGSLRGKTILSSNLNQLYFYSQNVLLFYMVGEDADIYRGYFSKAHQHEFVRFDSLSDDISDIIIQRLNLITFPNYTNTKDLKIPDKICWKYWEYGSGLWNTNSQRKNSDYSKMMFPFGKKAQIAYLNCDISFNHGWMEGCLEIVDKYFQIY